MYARGMSVREIQGHLRDLYGVDVSADLVSAVTDAVLEEIAEWQNRPLEPLYALVFFDAIRVKVRDEGVVRNKAVYVALGVRPDGTKEILGLWIEQTEGAKFWLRVMSPADQSELSGRRPCEMKNPTASKVRMVRELPLRSYLSGNPKVLNFARWLPVKSNRAIHGIGKFTELKNLNHIFLVASLHFNKTTLQKPVFDHLVYNLNDIRIIECSGGREKSSAIYFCHHLFSGHRIVAGKYFYDQVSNSLMTSTIP